MKHIFILVLLMTYELTISQNITGLVLEDEPTGNYRPLQGAVVHWLNGSNVVETDSLGKFSISKEEGKHMIIVSYDQISDTIHVESESALKIILKTGTTLKEVVITDRNNSKFLNLESIHNMQTMSSQELLKVACCNLSESFETNPSVDVSYSDALTGAKSIQMLGLSGKYTYMSSENLPSIRGLNVANGMNLLPGTWLQSIQVTKGIGSATSSFEGIGGEINTELKKPDGKENFLFNLYTNEMGRTELNLNHKIKISEKWSQYSMYHVNGMPSKQDINKDGYLNIPLGGQLNMFHRWKYQNTKGWIAQFGIQAVSDNRVGGSEKFNSKQISDSTSPYGLILNTKRLEFFSKLGYVFPQKKYKSIGILAKSYLHKQNDTYGLNSYIGNEEYVYLNSIYQSIIKTTTHKFRLGLSGYYNKYKELVFKSQFARTELSAGSFAEYTFTKVRFNAVLSFRLDYHNLVGWMFNPRLHVKYDFGTHTVLRFSAGRGQRIANIFAENNRFLMSNRTWIIHSNSGKLPYGLHQEAAWNYGFNLNHEWKINAKKGNLILDFYRTNFTQQVVIDVDKNVLELNIYNLHGQSYVNNAQIELNQTFGKALDLRLAYRFVDAKTTFHAELLQNPFIAKNRAFANIAWATSNRRWKFDYTLNWVGAKRVPLLPQFPTTLTFGQQMSPWYFQHNAQITKVFTKKFEVYVGAENLSNYIQKYMIINGSNPYGAGFDASMIWGPTIGRMVYAGLRYVY